MLNITDPVHPSLAGFYDTPQGASDVVVSGDVAYVADGSRGLQAINVTIPSQPTLAGSCDTLSDARDVFVSGDFAYVAEWIWGLQVINVTIPSQPSLAGTLDQSGESDGVFVDGDYAYLTDEWSLRGFRVVEARWSRPRQYEPLALAQSLPVFDAVSASVLSATLSVQHSIPSNTLVEYYMSADNGSHWVAVTPDVGHNFLYQGRQLLWRAVLTTSHALATPTIASLFITYATRLDAPVLVAPSDGLSTNDNTPSFEWEMVAGAASYRLQLDRVASFDSSDLVNATVVAVAFSPSSALGDGVWFWRVAARDINGDWGGFSATWSLDLEAGLPLWEQVPTSQALEFGLPFRYDLNASDPSGLDHWWLNDTGHFAIDGAGVVANATPLSVDYYGLQVWVNDTYGNVLTGGFMVTVQDTTAPTWDQSPTHQNIEVGERFRYDLNASDLSGIQFYWINDTVYFTVDGNGLISDAQDLDVGIYWLAVRAYDPYDHFCSAIFAVTVREVPITPPPPTVSPWMVPAIAVGSFVGGVAFAGVAAYLLLHRLRKSPKAYRRPHPRR